MNTPKTPRDLEALSPTYDDYVDDAVALANNRVSPERETQIRDRMKSDDMYRRVVEPILESYRKPVRSETRARKELDAFWKRMGLESPRATPDDDAEFWVEVKDRLREVFPRRVMLAAAGFVLLFVGMTSTWLFIEYRFIERITARPNVVMTVTLPDRSLVQMAPGAKIRYPKNQASRDDRWVTLEGEATFDVVSIAGRSFRVETGVAEVTVVGTRFRLEAHEGTTTVHVEEGTVRVQPMDEDWKPLGRPQLLGAGARARVTSAGFVDQTAPAPRTTP